MYIRTLKKLRHVNWKKVGLTALLVASVMLMIGIFLLFIGIFLLFIGVLIVGPPTPPAWETPANALITLVMFLVVGLTIYTFRGGGCRKKK